MAPRLQVATRRELMDHGFPATRIDGWLRNGRLVPQFRGVYSFGRDIETREAAWRAALAVAGPGSALTSRSALELIGAVRLSRRIPNLVQVATVTGRGGEHRGWSPALGQTRVRVLRRSLQPEDLRRNGGLDLVRPAVALTEFAAVAGQRDVRFAFLELCRLGQFTQEDVAASHRRLRGKRGATKLRPLLEMWVPELKRIRSVAEGSFLLDWLETGLKRPRVNEKVLGREVDFFWPEERLILEMDGASYHSDPLARKRDQAKQGLMESHGLKVIRVTWKEFEADSAGVIARVALELDRRTGRIGGR